MPMSGHARIEHAVDMVGLTSKTRGFTFSEGRHRDACTVLSAFAQKALAVI